MNTQFTFHIKQTNYGITAEKTVLSFHSPIKQIETARFAFAQRQPDAIVFVGDVLLARNVEMLMKQKGRLYPFSGFDLRSLQRDALVVGNFESAIPVSHRPTKSGEMNFSVDSQHLSSLIDAGFTHVSVANNHTYDYGKAGFWNTISSINDTGLIAFGNPKLLSDDSVTYLDTIGGVVALIGAYGLEEIPNQQQLEEVFDKAKKKSDLQIVYVHWGTEYMDTNDVSQRKIAESFVKAGADLIVGHHPHVVQNIEIIQGVPVFYSVGNYIFDQYLSTETEQGLVLTLQFDQEPIILLTPVSSLGSPSQPHEMVSTERAIFLSQLAAKSGEGLKHAIEQGIIPLNSLVASSSKIAMMD